MPSPDRRCFQRGDVPPLVVIRDGRYALSGRLISSGRWTPASRGRVAFLPPLVPLPTEPLPFLGGHTLPAFTQFLALIRIELLKTLPGASQALLFFRR